MRATLFNTLTGAITRHGSFHDPNAQCGADELWIEGQWADSQFYVAGGVAVPRPALDAPEGWVIAADDIEAITVTAPAGTLVRMPDGSELVLEDGVLEWSTALAGEYRFEFEPPFPWRSHKMRVSAHAG
jgi:hypothetical protein